VEEITKSIAIPVFLENDARCCCYGEQMLSMNHSVNNMLFILTEYRVLQPKHASKKNLSVGMGIILNGKIYKGKEYSAGEFRSMLWTEGNNGQFYSGEDRLEAIMSDSKEMQSVFFELAQHAAFLVNILNLDVVYIGGIDPCYAKIISDIISERIKFQWPYDTPREYEVRIGSLGSLAVAFGAASMFIDHLFDLPSLSTPSGTGPSIMESLSLMRKSGE
jgi:hypothetical protein